MGRGPVPMRRPKLSLLVDLMSQASTSGISPSFLGLSRSSGWVTHVLLTRSRLCPGASPGSSLHLHVLSTPPAFVLSQDQTLREELSRRAVNAPLRGAARTHGGEPGRFDGVLLVLLDFSMPAVRRGSAGGRIEPGRTSDDRPEAGRQVRMLLSFQRPSRLCVGGDSSRMRCSGAWLPSGQWSLAHPLRSLGGTPAARPSSASPRCGADCSSRAAGRRAAGRRCRQATRRRRKLALAELQHARRRARAAGTSSGVARPAARRRACTPPCGQLRRASEREPPERVGDQPGQVHASPSVGRAPRPPRSSSGSSCAMNTRSNAASASAAAAAPWKRVTSARASARLASRGARRPRAAALPEQQRRTTALEQRVRDRAASCRTSPPAAR